MRDRHATHARRQLVLRCATILAGGMLAATGTAAAAQQETAPPQDPAPEAAAGDEEIVVTGLRASLANAANAKRESVGFTESVFAEDIGDFPDTNLAESFNRVPGITISREITGEGLNIAIRGLGTNFTRVLLNNAPIAVASTGRTDAQNTNREVDLDLFPSELFSQLTVNKSALASQLEGGAAGTVNMRSARPFDQPGFRFNYSAQLTNNNNSDRWGGRASAIASGTWGNFGALVGIAAVRNEVRTTGFETIGWTNANLTTPTSIAVARRGAGAVPNAQDIADAQCRVASGCNATGGGNWTIGQVVGGASTIPSNAGNGLAPGSIINQEALLALNPGLTLEQIDNAILPRLGRPSDEFGRKDRISAILALEWRPSDDLHFYFDSMYARRENDLERIDMNWVVRNGAAIPINMEVDREDCSGGCVVTGGTFANSQFFLEYRPFLEDVEFWGINPGLEWQVNDRTRIDLQANWTESSFHRESPTVLVNTPANSGVTVEYSNDGSIPVIDTNVDLNDPANFVWAGGRVNIQDERRETRTRGVRGNLFWGEDVFNIRLGAAYDDVQRDIQAFDNSQAWQNAVCGNQPSDFLPSPNTQPPCQGLNAPGAAPPGYPTYPGYGTGFTAGRTPPVTYLGSLIPQSALASYLRPGPSGFVTVDWNRFRRDSNYDPFQQNAPLAGSANTGASAGFVREKVFGAYLEFNGDTLLWGNRLRWNVGARYVHTDQTIGGFVSISDPRNATLPDGARFPNVLNFVLTENSYENWLPAGNLAYNVTDNLLIRFAASKTMTRPNPNAMLPGVNFSNPSADIGSRGNPALEPFISDNLDLGIEWYTGQESYVALAAFQKDVTGFTVNGNVTLPFTDLAQYGITFDTLTPTQQAAINSRGGPNVATVVLTQQVNASGNLRVRGLEATWVQSLDPLIGGWGLEGFGFSVNGTYIDQDGEGAAPAVAIGVSRYSYNATFYYENHGISARISTTWNEGSQSSGANQNGITDAALFTNDYEQWDFSSSFDLAEIFDVPRLPTLTFDVVNLFEAKQRSYFQFENAAFTLYEPGRTVLIGLRGSF